MNCHSRTYLSHLKHTLVHSKHTFLLHLSHICFCILHFLCSHRKHLFFLVSAEELVDGEI
ncbi:hypothetical protein C0J52_13634 [Blattella germanica]|nr:hypothetical protein C0J52_13634 [Blattella germanica]